MSALSGLGGNRSHPSRRWACGQQVADLPQGAPECRLRGGWNHQVPLAGPQAMLASPGVVGNQSCKRGIGTLDEAGKAVRPWLGLQPEELSDELRAQLDLEEGTGLLVSDVLEGSPAQKAGLRKNDILLKIDGKPVKGEEMLAGYMKSARVGQESTLTVLRKGKEQTYKVTLAERKD